MLINVKVFKKKATEAWKSSGIEVALEPSGMLLHISGNDWYIIIDYERVPNKMKSVLVELIGEMPQPGMMISSVKGEEKSKNEWIPENDMRSIERTVRWHTTLTMFETGSGVLRVLEKEDSTEKVVIKETTRTMVNPFGTASEDFVGPVSAGGYWIAYEDGFTLILISVAKHEDVKNTMNAILEVGTECYLNEYLQR